MVVCKKNVLFMLCIIPIFKPYSIVFLYSGGIIDKLYDFFRILILMSCILLYLKDYFRKDQLTKNYFVVAAFIYQVCLFYSYSLAQDYLNRVGVIITCFGAVIIITYLFSVDSTRTIRCLSYWLTILITVNFIGFLIFPNGLNNSYNVKGRMNFLGKDNGYIVWAVISFFSVWCYQYVNNKKTMLHNYVIVINTITILLFSSSTGKASWILFMIVYYSKKIFNLIEKITFWKAIIAFTLVYSGLIVFNVQMHLSNIIMFLFNKGSDFSTRASIWITSKRLIAENPIFGIGRAVIEIDGWYGLTQYSHNMILDIMLKGGTVALIAFIIVLLMWNKNISKCKSDSKELYFVCIVSLCAMLISGLMEGVESSVQLWSVLAIASCMSAKNCSLINKDISVREVVS